MYKLYYGAENGLFEVAKVASIEHAMAEVAADLGKKNIVSYYSRYQVCQNTNIPDSWFILIDYGSWSDFYYIGDFKTAKQAEDHLLKYFYRKN